MTTSRSLERYMDEVHSDGLKPSFSNAAPDALHFRLHFWLHSAFLLMLANAPLCEYSKRMIHSLPVGVEVRPPLLPHPHRFSRLPNAS